MNLKTWPIQKHFCTFAQRNSLLICSACFLIFRGQVFKFIWKTKKIKKCFSSEITYNFTCTPFYSALTTLIPCHGSRPAIGKHSPQHFLLGFINSCHAVEKSLVTFFVATSYTENIAGETTYWVKETFK